MSSSAMHQPVSELVLKSSFHAKKISGPKCNSSSRVPTNQRTAVIVTLEHKRDYYRVKQHSKDRTLVKPGLLVEQNNGKQEATAKQETELEFPESSRNVRRNQDDESRAECTSPGNGKRQDYQKL